MEPNESTRKATVKDVAADIIYMTGGIDPDYVSINEIVTDTLEAEGIGDEDVIEEFSLAVHALIGEAIVTVRWPGDEDEYVFNDDDEDIEE